MGPPPRYLVTRKLVSHFFKKYIPANPEGASQDSTELFECWQKFGIDHPNCQDLEENLAVSIGSKKSYKEKIDGMQVRQSVLGALNRPYYPSTRKGKYKDQWHTKVWTIFDGLKH